MSSPAVAAEALRALAALLRAGLPLRAALLSWHEDAPGGAAPALRRVARRIAVGLPPLEAVRGLLEPLGADGRVVIAVVEVHLRGGGDGAAMLEAAAAGLDRRAAAAEAARAASAGAVLSGRLVASLPLLFLPFTPWTRGPLFDGPGIVVLLLGIGLALGGIRWMARLIPPPPEPDGTGWLAHTIACLLCGGVSLPVALRLAIGCAPEDVRVGARRALRSHSLGLTWTEALVSTRQPGLLELSSVLRRAERHGVPVRYALETFVGDRGARVERAFQATLNRAPVRMILPLTTCVLPSFALLAIVPFLRGLAAG